jgi:hypothetical protein
VSLPQPTQEVIVYKRIAESGQQVLVVHNLSPLTQSLDLGIRSEENSVVFSSDGSTFDGELIQMAPLSTAIYLLQ